MTERVPLPSSVPLELQRQFRFQWEAAQDSFVLLYPEGMVKLPGSAGEIMKRVDGTRSLDEIVKDLEASFPGTDLRADGRSRQWEFRFRLPARRALAELTLAPDEAAADIDLAPLLLVQRLAPADERHLAAPPLPEPFCDSPAVTAELAARGIDLIAGATDIRIEGRTDAATGVATWHAFAGRDELQLPFAP